MTYDALVSLLDYHYWARDRLLDALRALPPEDYTSALGGSYGSIRDTVVHIYVAERLWHARWQGISPTEPEPPDRFPDVQSLADAWSDLERRMRTMLREMPEDAITRVIDYRRLNGEAASSVFWHMVQHVVNHASYHRGQVTTLIRQVGAEPPESTDLITYYRQRQG